eukprot:Filipodium_phascolosomae@DN388_c0_g1_i1.p1
MKLVRNIKESLVATKIPDDPFNGPREELEELDGFLSQLNKCGKRLEGTMKEIADIVKELGSVANSFHEKGAYKQFVEDVTEGMRIWEDEKIRTSEQWGVIQQMITSLSSTVKGTSKQLQNRDRLFADYCHYESKVHRLQVYQHRCEAQAYAKGKGVPKGHEKTMEKVRRNSSKLDSVNHSFDEADKDLRSDVRDIIGSKYAKTNRILVLILENQLQYHSNVVQTFNGLQTTLEDLKEAKLYEQVNIPTVTAPEAAAATAKIRKERSKSMTQFPSLYNGSASAEDPQGTTPPPSVQAISYGAQSFKSGANHRRSGSMPNECPSNVTTAPQSVTASRVEEPESHSAENRNEIVSYS